MSPKLKSAVGYALLLVLLLAAYRGSALVYRAHVPLKANLANRQSRLGVFLFENHQLERGMELCQKSAATYPDSAEAHYFLAFLYDRQGRALEAIGEYREAIRCYPDWVMPHVNLGIVLGQMGRLEEALEEFRQAPNDVNARYNRELTEQAIERRRRQGASPR